MQKKALNKIDDRTKLLFGEKFEKIQKMKFVVCGLGGVGSIIPISLVRSGVKKLFLIDFDKVDESNLNRQLAYDVNDIGKFKVEAIKSKLLKIRDNSEITILKEKINNSFDFSIFNDCDFVFDCIDDVPAKIELITYCLENDIKIISSLGMGNRLDSQKVIITTLNKTHDDPLARKLRYELKKRNLDLKKLLVSFSTEKPIIKGNKVASIFFVPNVSGLHMASKVLNILLGLEDIK